MSVLQNPLIGRAKQKLGGSVFSTWKGINVLKGKPLSVANPKTDKQLMRRSALIQIVAIGRKIKAAVDSGFNEQAVRKSAFNAFTGYNLRSSFDYGAPPTATLEVGQLLIAQGTISPTLISSVIADVSDGNIIFEWAAGNLQPGQSNSDVLAVAIHNTATDVWYSTVTGSIRSGIDAVISIVDLPFVAGNTLDCYAFFYNSTSRKSSDSVYNQTVAIA